MADFTVQSFRSSIKKEKIINLNFKYLLDAISCWWEKIEKNRPTHIIKFELISILLTNLHKEDIYYFDKLGYDGIAGICITNIFNVDCPKLALVVHEALSDLFQLSDIKYPYEEHKALYLKPTGQHYKDWGNGYGEITPHSDDLYEDLDTDYLSLTVCRDITKTPTIYYLLKDVLDDFNDTELRRLFNMKAKFISGKNIQIIKMKERRVMEYCPRSGFKFFLDFRIDNTTGERMIPVNCEDKFLIDKMKNNMITCSSGKSTPETGTFLIVSNYKVLHSREQVNIDYQLASTIAETSNYENTPRLLYRSKGFRKDYILN